MNIILALIVFGLIVTFHEFGHFSLAKLCGIRVLEFSVGMGPKIASFVKRGTQYSLRMLPLGGYCSMLGEDTDAEDFTEGSLNAAPVWKRILIVAAGPMFNFILAFLLAVVILSQVGVDRCVLTGILEGYPAENSGIRPGDEIGRINDHKVVFFRDLTSYLYMYPGKAADVTVLRETSGTEGEMERHTFRIEPMYNTERGAWMLGKLKEQGRPLVLESELPVADAPEQENAIRSRRIAFYERNGFVPAYEMATCGMRWQAMLAGGEPYSLEDLMRWHKQLYDEKRTDVKVPLGPDEVPELPYWMK